MNKTYYSILVICSNTLLTSGSPIVLTSTPILVMEIAGAGDADNHIPLVENILNKVRILASEIWVAICSW